MYTPLYSNTMTRDRLQISEWQILVSCNVPTVELGTIEIIRYDGNMQNMEGVRVRPLQG
jgi:hypothetical protein